MSIRNHELNVNFLVILNLKKMTGHMQNLFEFTLHTSTKKIASSTKHECWCNIHAKVFLKI